MAPFQDTSILRTPRSRLAHLLEAERDRRRFNRREPGLRDYFGEHVFFLASELRKPYCRYMLACTKDDMPVTMGMACFFLACLRAFKPRSVLDLGSGFSSFVARFHAAGKSGRGCAVCSVDDDPHWLAVSREFVQSEGIPQSGLGEFVDWESFLAGETRTFDMVLVDLGSIETRSRNVREVLSRFLAPGGHALMDDMHFNRYRRTVLRACRELGMDALNMRSFVQDEYLKAPYLVYAGRSGQEP
jgi:SAM-dependent methyltransferase